MIMHSDNFPTLKGQTLTAAPNRPTCLKSLICEGYVTVSLQQSKITLQNNCINNTSITQPTLSFYLWVKNAEFATFTQTVMVRTVSLNTGSSPNIE